MNIIYFLTIYPSHVVCLAGLRVTGELPGVPGDGLPVELHHPLQLHQPGLQHLVILQPGLTRTHPETHATLIKVRRATASKETRGRAVVCGSYTLNLTDCQIQETGN